MTQDRAIAVDFSQSAATSKVIKRPNLLSSHQANWDGIYLEHHQHPPHETPEHYPLQHVIAIHAKHNATTERRLDGRWRQEQIKIGDICIVPAQTRHWVHSQGEQELILLSFESELLETVAYESTQNNNIELLPHFAQSDPLIYQIGLSLKKVLENDPVGSKFYAESLITGLAAHVIQFYTVQKSSLDLNVGDNFKIRQAIEYIHAHLNEDLSLDAIALTLGISKYHFCRLFKQSTGLTPWQYVIQLRITAAKKLLAKPNLSIAQISRQLGYSTQGQFTNFFRKHTGFSPTNYRQKL